MPEETKELAEKGSCMDIAPAKLTVDQERFLARRMAYSSDGEAAASCGLNPKTPAEWKRRNAEFRRRYDQIGEDARLWAAREIRSMFREALAGLRDGLASNNERTRAKYIDCLLYTSPSPRDGLLSRMPSSA